jgi:AraC-like DNA-binding protein
MVQESETDEELAFYKNVFRSDFFSLLWVVSGTVDISVNLKLLHAKVGDLVVAAPNAPKQLQNVSEDCIIEGVTFTVDFLVALNLPQNHLDMMEFFASQFNPLWSLNDEERLLCSSLIASLQEKTTKMPDHLFGKEILHNAFLIFLYEMAALSKKYAILNEASYNRKEELMLNFMRMASLHYKQEKNLAFYAKRLYVSSKHLSETVKEISTKTAGEILDDLIILESKVLLSDIALSISDIAAQLNFSDRSFFGKFFKRHTGLSPRHYRQSLI